jgi:hypothetical protein
MKKFCLALTVLAAVATAQTEEAAANPDLRKPRSTAVSLEIGANSISSLAGLKGTFFVTPQVALDAGLGILTVTGLRPGIYGRYLFNRKKFSPFAYAGLKYGIGSGGQAVEVEDPDTDVTYGLKVKPSPYADFGLGIDYLAHNGFYLTGGLGWSQLLSGKNYEWEGAVPPEEFDDAINFMLGSGLGLFLSLGYAF